jgi:hypothetical protein
MPRSGNTRNKNKNWQMRLHEIKRFLHSKGNNFQIKKQPTEWKKIFSSYLLDKGLISKIYKELKKLSTQEKLIQLINGK